MSVSWDIGFRERPEVSGLDSFMQSLGFTIEPHGQRKGRFIRVYNFSDESQAPREIEFFYNDQIDEDQRQLFEDAANGNNIKAYGNLKTYSVEEAVSDPEERVRIIKEKGIVRQHDYYKHLATERLKFYETALAFRDQFDAIVVSEDGKEIDPDRNPFTRINDLKK